MPTVQAVLWHTILLLAYNALAFTMNSIIFLVLPDSSSVHVAANEQGVSSIHCEDSVPGPGIGRRRCHRMGSLLSPTSGPGSILDMGGICVFSVRARATNLGFLVNLLDGRAVNWHSCGLSTQLAQKKPEL